MWREQAEIKLAQRGISIVAWCHNVKVAHLLLCLSNHNKGVLGPGCEDCARYNLQKKIM